MFESWQGHFWVLGVNQPPFCREELLVILCHFRFFLQIRKTVDVKDYASHAFFMESCLTVGDGMCHLSCKGSLGILSLTFCLTENLLLALLQMRSSYTCGRIPLGKSGLYNTGFGRGGCLVDHRCFRWVIFQRFLNWLGCWGYFSVCHVNVIRKGVAVVEFLTVNRNTLVARSTGFRRLFHSIKYVLI